MNHPKQRRNQPRVNCHGPKTVVPALARRRTFICLAGLLVAAGPSAGGEPPSNDPIQPQATSDTFVDDSFEAGEWLHEIERQSRAGRWMEASRLVHQTFQAYSHKLVRTDQERYESIPRRLARLVSGWPPPGLDAYRSLYDAEARAAIEEASQRRDTSALLRLFEQYFCTAPGRALGESLLEAAVEEGDFALALHLGERLIADHPDGPAAEATLVGRLGMVAALAGDQSEAQRWSQRSQALGAPDVTWLGQPQNLAEAIDGVLRQRSALPQTVEDDWPVFGGAASRNRAAAFPLDETALLWRLDELSQVPADHPRAEDAADTPDDEDLGKQLVMQPVVAEGLVLVQSTWDVWAIHENGGTLAWHFRAPEAREGLDGDSETGIPQWRSPTLHAGRVYASLGAQAGAHYGYDAATQQWALASLDARTGRLLWKTDQSKMGETLRRMTLDSSPLVWGGGVYVVGRKHRTFGFEDCYLLRFNADDGACVGQTHVGSAASGGFGFRRPTMSITALTDDVLYVSTNLGTLAAVSARTGWVEWLRVYERERITGWTSGAAAAAESVMPWHYNPALCEGRRVVFRPLDAAAVWVVERSTGASQHVLAADELFGASSLLGLQQGRLYGLGDRVFCYDLDRGQLVWAADLPEGVAPYGRAVLTEAAVLVPTRAMLCSFARQDGRRMDQLWSTADEGGNLLALNDRLIVTGTDHLSLYGRRSAVWARLRDLIAARPHDAGPVLDLAEIALRTGDRDEARMLFEQALDRAEQFGTGADETLRRRLFQDCLWFAKSWARESPEDRETSARFYRHASRWAPETADHVAYRFAFAEYLTATGAPAEAVAIYQQVLGDRSLREWLVEGRESAEPAGAIAWHRIDALLADHGRWVYEPFESEAAQWLDAARATGDAALLERIVVTRPCAAAAPEALLAWGELLRARGQAAEAARRLVSAWGRYRKQLDGARVIRLIADSYADADADANAWLWVLKGAREFPQARWTDAGTSLGFREYAERFKAFATLAGPRRPRLSLPPRRQYTVEWEHDADALQPTLEPTGESTWNAVLVWVDGRLNAYNSRDGSLRWTTPWNRHGEPSLLAMTAERLLVATRFEILAYDAADGRQVWSVGKYPAELEKPEADPEWFPTFYGHALDRHRLLSVRDDGWAACVDVTTGQPIWERILEYRPTGPPKLYDRWIVYQGLGTTTSVYAVVDAQTGSLLQAIDADDDGHVLELHLTAEGRLILVLTRFICAYELDSGSLLWRRRLTENVPASSVVFDLDGVVLSDDGVHLRKFGFETGDPLWKSARSFHFTGEAAHVLSAAGLVLLCTEQEISALDMMDGRLAWESSAAEADYRNHFVTESGVLTVKVSGTGTEARWTTQFLDLHGDPPPPDGKPATIDLGQPQDVLGLTIRDDALLILNKRRLIGWTTDPASP